jgi:cytochrome c oxidase subunit II
MTSAMSVIDAAGPQAGRLALMWWVMFWTCLVVQVVVLLIMLGALWRRRGTTSRGADVLPAQPPIERRLARTVIVGVALSVLILAGLFGTSVAISHGIASFGAQAPVTIEVTGRQWWWQVEYDAPTPDARVTTANEIHIPVGRAVLVKLRSSDVIHSLWIPNLHGKLDLIPGHPTTMRLQADRPGVYRGQCAEFCGLQHAHMGLLVVAVPPQQFEAWLIAQRQPAATPGDAFERRGHDVFLTGSCVLCHTIRGTTAGSRVGPDLTHVGSRLSLAAGTLPNTPGHRAGWITSPQSIKPGVLMPGTALEADDLNALVAYLATLQ